MCKGATEIMNKVSAPPPKKKKTKKQEDLIS